MVSQQQEVKRAQGNSGDEIQAMPTIPAAHVAQNAVKASSSVNAAATTKKRRQKYRELLVDASEVSPRPSIWPLILAFSIAVALFGLIWNAVVLIIGVVLIVGSILGWSLEKRDHTYKSAVPVKKVSTRDAEVPADAMERDK